MLKNVSFKQYYYAGFVILTLFISIFYSCKKTIKTSNQKGFEQSAEAYIHAGVTGKVLYEDGMPASNVTVNFVGVQMKTNNLGEFDFNEIPCPKSNALIHIQVDGYFPAYRSLIMTADAKEYTVIRLLKKELVKKFSSSEKSIVQVRGGGEITFEENSFVDELSETNYTGNVSVYAVWIDPSGEYIDEFLPGSLRGITLQNRDENIATFGMVAVEIYGENGNKLQLKKGKTARLELPIPQQMVNSAPSNIPLWSLNEKTGVWKEEESAIKNGMQYEGNVTHFSFWNLDQPGVVGFTIDLVDSVSNTPIAFRTIRIKRLLTNTSSSGNTNSNGIATGYIFPNESYQLEVILNCGGVNTVLKTVYFNSPATAYNYGQLPVNIVGNTAIISGTVVDVNNIPIANTTVTAKVTGAYGVPVKLTTDANGQFSYSSVVCNNSVNLTLCAYDEVNLTNSGPLNFTAQVGTQNIGILQTTGQLTEYIKIVKDVNGILQDFRIVEPHASITCSYNINQGGFLYVNSFSNLLGVDWRCSFRVLGPLGIAGTHNMNYYYEKINVNTVNSSQNPILPNTVNFMEYGTLKDEIISGRHYVELTNQIARTIEFRIKKDN